MDKNLQFLRPVLWIVFTLCHTQHKGYPQVISWFHSFINTTKTISPSSYWVLTPLGPCSPKSLYWTEIIVSSDALEMGIQTSRNWRNWGESRTLDYFPTVPWRMRTSGEFFLESSNILQRNNWWYLFFKFQPPSKGRYCFRSPKCQSSISVKIIPLC